MYQLNCNKEQTLTLRECLNVFMTLITGVSEADTDCKCLTSVSLYRICVLLQPIGLAGVALLICKTQTPLIRFVVDLLYNKLYNKSTTSRHIELLYEMLYNKSKSSSMSTTNRIRGL